MASRNDGRGDAPTITRRRHVLACARCRARRVRCDRAQPTCSNCVKAGALCQPVQQSDPAHAALASRPGSREPADRNRLSKLEEEVARLSREVESRSPSQEPSLTPPLVEGRDNTTYATHGRIVKGDATRYLSPLSWAAVAEDVVDLDSILAADFGSSIPRSSGPEIIVSEETSIPLISDQLHENLLGIFSHRVDPIVRILHWPSFLDKSRAFRRARYQHIQSGSQYLSAYSPSPQFDQSHQQLYLEPQSQAIYGDTTDPTSPDSTFSALLHSVYYAAVVSIVNSPNPPNLGQNVSIASLESALRRGISKRVLSLGLSLAGSESIEALQAMILYLSVEGFPSYPQLRWLQLGAAIRMAQGLGLHRDSSNFTLGPVEMEMRRRLWAQICVLDVQLAEQLCREPSILPDSYDTSLPLSIGDQKLADIEQQSAGTGQHREGYFKSLHEIEQSQEHQSPFSPMTASLIEAEIARFLQQLLCFRYRATDNPFRTDSPHPSRRATSIIAPAERFQWVGRLENRLQTRYLDNLKTSDPLQFLVSEISQINIAKAKFMIDLSQRRDALSRTPASNRLSDITKLFHDALYLATRCVALMHQYSSSIYSWYTSRMREVYSSSFLALVLASDQPITQEDTNAAWAVLDQLYPVDATGQLLNVGLSETLLGKVFLGTRLLRTVLHVHGHTGQHLRERAMQAAAGAGFPASSIPHVAATLATTMANTSSYQSSGNLFEDLDALMQDPMWPSGMGPTDTNYWPLVQPSTPDFRPPYTFASSIPAV